MVIAVTNGLGTLSERLRALGYDVVTYGAYKYPVDALVYSGEGLSELEVTSAANRAGVLMINAQGKTVGEIDAMLKRRTYTPLF